MKTDSMLIALLSICVGVASCVNIHQSYRLDKLESAVMQTEAVDNLSEAVVTTNKAFQVHIEGGFVPMQDMTIKNNNDVRILFDRLRRLEDSGMGEVDVKLLDMELDKLRQEFDWHLKNCHGGDIRELFEKAEKENGK